MTNGPIRRFQWGREGPWGYFAKVINPRIVDKTFDVHETTIYRYLVARWPLMRVTRSLSLMNTLENHKPGIVATDVDLVERGLNF
jgi:hypothetical protein